MADGRPDALASLRRASPREPGHIKTRSSRQAVTASVDGTLILWDLSGLQPVRRIDTGAQGGLSTTKQDAQQTFTDLATGLDLDIGLFESCIKGADQAKNVQANLEEALAFGVNSTPISFINGYGVPGVQPYETFEMAVELTKNDELAAVVEEQARQMYEAMLVQPAAEPE